MLIFRSTHEKDTFFHKISSCVMMVKAEDAEDLLGSGIQTWTLRIMDFWVHTAPS